MMAEPPLRSTRKGVRSTEAAESSLSKTAMIDIGIDDIVDDIARPGVRYDNIGDLLESIENAE